MAMVTIPNGLHQQAGRAFGGNVLAYRPGNGSGKQPMARPGIMAYNRKITGGPLPGGQVQAHVPTGGKLQLSVGPQGAGTVWYPAQVTISTTTGALDGSTCLVYLGSQQVPVTLLGTVFPGGAGTLSAALPSLTPRPYLIFQWSNAHVGDTAGANIVGSMDALATGG